MEELKLEDYFENAERAMKALIDEWLIKSRGNWRPVYGLLAGCLEQLKVAKEEAGYE